MNLLLHCSSLLCRIALALPIALTVAGAFAGCALTEPVDPSFPVDGHRILVLPFKDRLQYHFDSQVGIGLARRITERLVAQHEEQGEVDAIAAVPFEELESAVGKIRKDPKDIAPADLGRSCNADLVLIGSIERFETKIPGDIGMVRGRASATFRVIDVAKPDRTFFKPDEPITITYPPSGRFAQSVGDPDAEADRVAAGLISELSKKIGEHFYFHEIEKAQPGY